MIKRIEILGVPVDCVTMDSAVNYAESIIRDGKQQVRVVAVNPEKAIRAQEDDNLLSFLKNSQLLLPDGIGLVKAAKFLRLAEMERVPGSEFMPSLCERAAKRGFRIFLFGGKPEVTQKAVDVLRQTYPGIQIVGHQDGYVDERGMPELINRINASQADILFLALGSPKQELWMDRYLAQTNVRLCQGVGGTFDVIAGTVKRAPLAFRKLNLEWFYRLAAQPSRVLRQTALPKFAFRVLCTKWSN